MKNMFITGLIFLVLSTSIIDGLSCIGNASIEIDLDELTHEKFQEKLDNVTSSDYDADMDDIVECRIIITVNYTLAVLIVEFEPGSAKVTTGDTNDFAILYTIFGWVPYEMSVSTLIITCSSEDDCDENFLAMDNHYQWWWLIDEVDHNEIEQMFKNLLLEEQSPSNDTQCYNQSTIVSCRSKICLLQAIWKNEPHQTCFTATQGTLYLIIQTQMMINSPTDRFIHAVDYTCQFDLCNDQSILLQANNITDMHYHVSPMLRVFTQKSSSTSNFTQSTSASASFESSSTSILMQSTTEVDLAGNRLKVSIELISLIFQICALLFV